MNRAETLPALRATGVPHKRVDGTLKVTGAARYAAEFTADAMTYGFVVSSTIATGRIVSVDASAALALRGVLLVLTHQNRPPLPLDEKLYKDMIAPGGTPFRPLWDERVWYSGQPVALVVAESLELARYAASLVDVHYESTPHRTDIGEAVMSAVPPSTEKGGFDPPPPVRGDPHAALASAVARVDAFYSTPAEYHSPMEMHGCTVVPDEQGRLTVYEKTQGVGNTKSYLTQVFGLKDDEVQVIAPFVGGAFGSGLRPYYHLALAVMAARELKRPVRLTLTRQQMFTFAHRPQSIQRVALGADAQGRLQAVIHEAVAETSQYEDYCDVTVNWAGQLYRCDNVTMGYKLVRLDVPTPSDARAPGATQGLFALEMAMDELAEALQMDPLELRLVNYAERDANKNLPFSSKALRECYREGAARFGWSKRPLAPRARREGRELIGWGIATGAWDAMQNEAAARAVMTRDGHVTVSSSTADIGTGTYTAMSQIAADALGVAVSDVSFELGDTRLPKAPIEGGSWTVSSVGSAVDVVCKRLHNRLVELAREHGGGRFATVSRDDVRRSGNRLVCGPGAEDAIAIDTLLERAGLEEVAELVGVKPHEKQQANSMGTHSAVFVEVRVDEALGTVRVTRVVSAIAAGRIVNPKMAANQIAGGVVWGISMALHEHGQFDHALGRQMNHNFAEYHVPVNADIRDIVNPLGVKGVGEIGVVGVAAAVSNAIWHATGKRIRDLPITLDKLIT